MEDHSENAPTVGGQQPAYYYHQNTSAAVQCNSILVKPLEKRLFIENDGTTLELYKNESIIFIGYGFITVLRGIVEYMGAVLNSENCKKLPFFAPETHALYPIQLSGACSDAAMIFIESGDSRWQNLAVHYRYKSLWSILGSQNLQNPSEDGVDKEAREEKGPVTVPLAKTCSILMKAPQRISKFYLHPLWEQSINSMKDISSHNRRLSVFLIGSKSSGKSTFVRYCINQFLTSKPTNRVALLDLDPGQPETSPGGLLSLNYIGTPVLGPSFTHLSSTPYRCEFLATLSPGDCPKKYVNIAHKLVKIMRTEVPNNVPIIVNTMGWTTGLGLEFIQILINMINPTHIIPFIQSPQHSEHDFASSNEARKFLDALEESLGPGQIPNLAKYSGYHFYRRSTRPTIIPIPSRSSFSFSSSKFYSPKDLRFLSYAAYLTLLNLQPQISYFPMDMIIPYEFPFANFPHISMHKDDVLLEYNCSIVALYIVHSYAETHITEKECIGLGFVRAVDLEKSSFHVITPVSIGLLQRVSHLERGYQMNISPIDYSDAYTNGFAYKPLASRDNVALGTTARKPRHNILFRRGE